jgi:hypothetical protein
MLTPKHTQELITISVRSEEYTVWTDRTESSRVRIPLEK